MPVLCHPADDPGAGLDRSELIVQDGAARVDGEPQALVRARPDGAGALEACFGCTEVVHQRHVRQPRGQLVPHRLRQDRTGGAQREQVGEVGVGELGLQRLSDRAGHGVADDRHRVGPLAHRGLDDVGHVELADEQHL